MQHHGRTGQDEVLGDLHLEFMVVISLKEGHPNIDLNFYCNPYYKDPQSGTPNFGKPPFQLCASGPDFQGSDFAATVWD